jgi:hypothetical protein
MPKVTTTRCDPDDDLLIAELEAYFEKLARDPEALAAYNAETHDLEASFGPSTPLSKKVLLAHWRGLPSVDPAALRADIDELIDPSL